MPRDQLLMGIAVASVCLLGLWKDRWFLANTKKGKQFARWFGEERGLWALRILFGVGALFGVLLASDIIRPIAQW
jgi:hypothetical protein